MAARERHRGRGELDPVAEARRLDRDLDELVDLIVETHMPREERS